MSVTPDGPDWAALYLQHRDAMYRAARRLLAEFGMADRAWDAVQDAMASLMGGSQVQDVQSWEALMVSTAARRAIDIGKSAAVRHDGGGLEPEYDVPDDGDFTERVEERIDAARVGAVLWDKLALLTDGERYVVREYVEKARARADVAEDLGVTPARVNQLRTQGLRKLARALEEDGYTYEAS